jgi:hypothetical protein
MEKPDVAGIFTAGGATRRVSESNPPASLEETQLVAAAFVALPTSPKLARGSSPRARTGASTRDVQSVFEDFVVVT